MSLISHHKSVGLNDSLKKNFFFKSQSASNRDQANHISDVRQVNLHIS